MLDIMSKIEEEVTITNKTTDKNITTTFNELAKNITNDMIKNK